MSGLAWGLWLASGMRALAVAVVIAVLAAPPAEAQTPTPDPAPPGSVAGDSTAVPDSVAAPPRPRATIPYGQATTYRAILAESRGLRLVRPRAVPVDSAGAPLGIGRLVVDETLTRTGSYFYDVFYRLWRPPPDAQFVSVVLQESPVPGQGTLVAVRLDGELVFQSRLTPNEEQAETLARQAVRATLQRVTRG